MNGILCVNKPSGLTSFDVVAKLRRILGIKKIGHAGTLDPMATGVLPVLIGQATKALPFLPNKDKRYVARVAFGKTTNTLDITGEVLRETRSHLKKCDIDMCLKKYVGKISQIPPMYSAVKKNGIPLYKLAREGKIVDRSPREVEIYQLKCLQFDEEAQEYELEIFCSSGTYIRTLCDDLGRDLGVGGVLTKLVRTMACGYELDECKNLDEISEIWRIGKALEIVFPIESLFCKMPKLSLDPAQERMFRKGVRLSLGELSEVSGRVAVYGKAFLGLAHPQDGKLKIDRMFVEDNDA